MVGTYNYVSPEVLDGTEQTLALDLWALGSILFKMFVGKLPFPGVNQPQIEKLIKNRDIQWPKEEELESIMSPEAKDLINRLIQLEPFERIGATQESMKELKAHPFFEDIDFEKVSQPGFTGASELVVKLVYKIQMEKIAAEKAKELEAK